MSVKSLNMPQCFRLGSLIYRTFSSFYSLASRDYIGKSFSLLRQGSLNANKPEECPAMFINNAFKIMYGFMCASITKILCFHEAAEINDSQKA